MSSHINRELSTLGIVLTDQIALPMTRLVIGFETRGSHALALNGQLLGVHPIVFTSTDRHALFMLAQVDESEVAAAIRRIPSISPNHKVVSDPFNVLSIWLIHLARVMIQRHEAREAFELAVAKYLHYRFFTSFLNRMFKHGANEKNMAAAIDNLSRKFDIATHGTWRAVIEERCRDLLSAKSIHAAAFDRADDDHLFTYAITDTQTRVRDKIKKITDEFYKARDQGSEVVSRSSTVEIDGQRLIVSKVSAYDAVISNLCAQVMSQAAFIDRRVVAYIANQFPAVSTNLLLTVLSQLSQTASLQARSGTLMLTETRHGQPVYIGVRALITAFVQASFRHCALNGVDLSKKLEVYLKIKNVYSSSRVADPDINAVKTSLAVFVDSTGKTSREATKSSLRIAIVLYLLVRGFAFL